MAGPGWSADGRLQLVNCPRLGPRSHWGLVVLVLSCCWQTPLLYANAQGSSTGLNATTESQDAATLETPAMTTEAWSQYRVMWLPTLGENVTEANRNISGDNMFCVVISQQNSSSQSTPPTSPSLPASADNQFGNYSLENSTIDYTTVAPSSVLEVSYNETLGNESVSNMTEGAANVTYTQWNCTVVKEDFSSVPTNISNSQPPSSSMMAATAPLQSETSVVAQNTETPSQVFVTMTSLYSSPVVAVSNPSSVLLPSNASSVSSSAVLALPSISVSLPYETSSVSAHISTSDIVNASVSDSILLNSMLLQETSTTNIQMVANSNMTSLPVSSVSLSVSVEHTDAISIVGDIQPTQTLNISSLDTQDMELVTNEPIASMDIDEHLYSSSQYMAVHSSDLLQNTSELVVPSPSESTYGVPEATDSGLNPTDSTLAHPLMETSELPFPGESLMTATPPLASDVFLSADIFTTPPSDSTSHWVAPTQTVEVLPTSGEYWEDDDDMAQNDIVSVMVTSLGWDYAVTTPLVPDQSEILLMESSGEEDIVLFSSSPQYGIFPSESDIFTEDSMHYPSDDFMYVISSPVEEILGMSSSYPLEVLLTPVLTDTLISSNEFVISDTDLPILTTNTMTTNELQSSTQDISVQTQNMLSASSLFLSESFIIPSSIDVVEFSASPSYPTSSSISLNMSDTVSDYNYTSVPSAMESSTASPLASTTLLSSSIGGTTPLSSLPSSTPTGQISQPGPFSSTALPDFSPSHTTSDTSSPLLSSSQSVSSFPSFSSSAVSSVKIPSISPTSESVSSQTTPQPVPTSTPSVLLTTSSVLSTNPQPSESSSLSSTSSSPNSSPSTTLPPEPLSTTLVTPTTTEQLLTTTVVVTTTPVTTTPTTLPTTTLPPTPSTTTISTSTVQTTTAASSTTATTSSAASTTTNIGSTSQDSVGGTSPSTTSVTQPSSIETTTETTTVSMTTPHSTTLTSTLPPTSTTTTEVPLNTSESYKEFWVKTVIKEDPDVDLNSDKWLGDMEYRLASIYEDGFQNVENDRRQRRATTFGDTTLQMVNASRDSVAGPNVTLLYYMERYGNVTPALSAVAAMETFGFQELALRLGRVVIVKAEVYAPPVVPPPHDPRLWLIGAVIGGIIGSILLIWCVLFIYCKCNRPNKTQQRAPRTPRSTRISMTGDTFDTNSYRSKMPKIQNGIQNGVPKVKKSTSPEALKSPLPKGKEVGFDIARTEVGLESEIQRDLKRKPSESYRRHPDGSTELEGMYSNGETPPPKPMGYTNTPPGRIREAGEGEETHTLNRNSRGKSRSQIPIDASLRRSLPPRPDTSQETLHPPKKKSSKKKHAESEESDSEDDRPEDRKPLSPEKQDKQKKSKKKTHKARNEEKAKGKSRKKKHQSDEEEEDLELDSSQAAIYENVAKMSRGDLARPEVKLRATQHAIRLPPLITQPLVSDSLTRSIREETELQESLQQKADIERWRNKQRQRERTKGSKTHLDGESKEARRAYRRAQLEIGDILGDVGIPQIFQKKQKRKKHHKRSGVHPVAEASPDQMEMRDMFGPTNAQYNHLDGIDKQKSPASNQEEEQPYNGSSTTSATSATSSTSSEDGSYLADSGVISPEPTLEEARLRMHALVDNAFALISPYHRRRNRVAPSHILLPRGPAPPPAHGKASAARTRRRHVAASGGLYRSREQVVWEPEDDGPRHTPMYIKPVTKQTSPSGKVVWSPYTAADEAAKIPDTNEPFPPGIIQTTPDVREVRSSKVVQPVAAYNYSNPAFVKDSNPEPGTQAISETSITQSEPPESSRSIPVVQTSRAIRKAMAPSDDYTSIVMDSSMLNSGVVRSHSPPERDSDVLTSKSQDPTRHVVALDMSEGDNKVDSSSRQSTGHQSLNSQSGSNKSGKGLLGSLPEQSSLQMPSTDFTQSLSNVNDEGESQKQPMKNLDPEIPKLSKDRQEDEIDIIQRAKPGKHGQINWEKSLRSELERLANRSSADTTITTTAMV